ncbi:MAG: holo-ACP synthase [Candidatus Muiribacteriota bacterium]
MIGIDIVENIRIKKLYSQYGFKFISRILSEEEVDIFNKKEKGTVFLSARFAAKEAFIKASGMKNIAMNKIIILNTPQGAPFFKDYNNYALSISHEKKYSVAMVVKK